MDSYNSRHEYELQLAATTRKLMSEVKSGVGKKHRSTLSRYYGKSNKALIKGAIRTAKERAK
jgi:hypothetical protein